MINARYVTAFDGGVFVAGFNAMLVLIKQLKERRTNVWHLVMERNGTALSYLTARKYASTFENIQKMMAVSFVSSCNIVGWCSDVEDRIGEPF